jgi:hypothetical protein
MIMQLRLHVANRQQMQKAWAFAIDKSRSGIRTHRNSLKRDYQKIVITSASKEARILGVESGMSYSDAKILVPDLKVLVVN